ncbi:hypothetical protein BJY52DRAFT_1416821 [Lactarius psammicola]|nr:hypothetical protein BJY52DRAFT_1416821 [Lactarius psammicola]
MAKGLHKHNRIIRERSSGRDDTKKRLQSSVHLDIGGGPGKVGSKGGERSEGVDSVDAAVPPQARVPSSNGHSDSVTLDSHAVTQQPDSWPHRRYVTAFASQFSAHVSGPGGGVVTLFTLVVGQLSSASSMAQTAETASLKAYKKKTKQDLIDHPLASQLQACNPPAATLTTLRDQIHQLEQSRSGDERFRRWLNPKMKVLYAFSATLGEGVGPIFSPAKVIFAGAGVLLLAAKDIEASQDLLIDVFERFQSSIEDSEFTPMSHLLRR